MISMTVGFIVNLEFTWGFQCRVAGLSKTSPSFYYPPPTVMLGGIAESIARKHNIGENDGKKLIPALSRNLLAIGVKPLNCIPITYQALSRIIAIRKTGEAEYPTPEPKYILKSFDAPARGHTLLSTMDGDSPQIKLFVVFKNDEIKFSERKLKLSGDDFWRIHRLGSKESLVSVLDVMKIDGSTLNEIRDATTETNYSFPIGGEFNVEIVGRPKGLWVEEEYINPFKVEEYDEKENPVLNYMFGRKLIKFKIPLKSVEYFIEKPACKLKIQGNVVAYEYEGEVIIGYG